MFKIALRNIFRHKARSLIALSTIAFGCVALMFVGGFFDDTLHMMRESSINSQTGHLQIYVKGFDKEGKVSPYNYLIKDPQVIIDIVKTLPQVKSIGSRLQFAGLISIGNSFLPCMAQGVDVTFDQTFLKGEFKDLKALRKNKDANGLGEIIAGDRLNPQEDPYTLILGKGLAEALNISPGAYVTLMTNTVQGGNNALDMRVKGILRTSSKDYDDVFLRMPIASAQKILNTTSVQNIVVKLHHTEDTLAVQKELSRLFAERHLDFEIKTWVDLSDFYVKTVELFNAFHGVMRIVIAIAVILGIFNTMNMAIMERFSEIGTIMAMGVKRRGVLVLFLYEGLLLGLIGGILGVILGSIIIFCVGQVGILMPPPPGATMIWLSQPSILLESMVFTFVLSIVIGGISAVVPAFKASRLEIVEALRYR